MLFSLYNIKRSLFSFLSHSVSAHPDSGECPETSFECLGGRCLPLSWRCNGQVECLGEGPSQGTDEQGCNAEAETPEPPKHHEEAEREVYPDTNDARESEKHKATEKTQSLAEMDPDSDLWELLKERAEEEAQVDRQQPPPPQTHKEPAVTPTPIQWPCGGLLQAFYGTFSPPAQRGPAQYCVWTLDPQDSRPLRLDLQQLVLGPGDRLTIYNREEGKGDVIKIVSQLLFFLSFF